MSLKKTQIFHEMLLSMGRPKEMWGHEGVFFTMLDTDAGGLAVRETFMM